MKNILSLQTLISTEKATLCNASNLSVTCKKQSSISLFLCVKTTDK